MTQDAARRRLPTAASPEVRLAATLRHRVEGRIDVAVEDPPPDPSFEAVVAAVAPWVSSAQGVVLTGGDPTLRADLPRLLGALQQAGAPYLGVETDGALLSRGGVAERLAALGLARVRVRLHSARADAHDWLADDAGSFKRAARALQLAAAAGLDTEVSATITRPTRPYLVELVELAVRLGVSRVVLRRLTARGPARADDVALLPRFGLMQAELEGAVQAGLRQGVVVAVEGVPRCVAPGAAAAMVATDAVVWALPSDPPWPFLRPLVEPPPSEPGCASCPGEPACCRAPTDYLRRHGRTEIDAESNRVVRPVGAEKPPLAGGDVRPPPRDGRFPPLKLSYVRATSRLPGLGGDPLLALSGPPVADPARTLFLAPSRIADPLLGDRPGPDAPESTRAVRIRLVRLAQHGVRTLRVASAGSLCHPDAAELLRECTRLEFARIEVAGEGSGLADMSDLAVRRLRGLSRIDVALFGPDAASHDAVVGRAGAFDATLDALDRVANLVPALEVGCYAVLRTPEHLGAFAEAWHTGELPGAPWFRLAPTGGDLTALVAAAEALPEGPARDAIAAVLPRSLFAAPHVLPAPAATSAWGDFPEVFARPSGSDRYGCYTGRLSREGPPEPGDCPGFAEGWKVGSAGG